MQRLVDAIAGSIRETVNLSIAGLKGTQGELRSVFHGPPLTYLRLVYGALVESGGIPAVLPSGEEVLIPVLLQVETDQLEMGNPPVGTSGECDQAHLLALRNSPDCPRFLALVPPGQYSSLSVTSASIGIGLSAENNSGSATIDQWWHDRYVQALVDMALVPISSDAELRHGGARLIESAVRAADEIDEHDVSREKAWDVLARVMQIGEQSSRFGLQLSLACGVPPTEDGSIRVDEQLKCLARVSRSVTEDGFRAGIDQLRQSTLAEADKAALDALLAHLQHCCDIPAAFDRVPQFFYAPYPGSNLAVPPEWWTHMTVERWTEMLEEDQQPVGALVLRCNNSVVPKVPGLDAIVRGEAQISVASPDGSELPDRMTITRQAGGAAGRRRWELSRQDDGAIIDDDIPMHRTAVRYSVEAENHRKSSIKVVSLEAWEPGVVPYCRTARKLWLPKKAKQNKQGVGFECSLEVLGRGRHYIDLYVRPGVTIGEKAFGGDDVGLEDTASEPLVSHAHDHIYGFEVDATSECYYDVQVLEGDEEYVLRVRLTCDDAIAEGCKTEFDRLIRLNRLDNRRAAPAVQLDRQARCADLQGWMLDPNSAQVSFAPIVLGPDYSKRWRQPSWTDGSDTIFSRGQFIHDPRPSFDELAPPDRFVKTRVSILERIRGPDGSDLVEAAKLGEWLATDPGFASLIEEYVGSYIDWLAASPDMAAWSDVALVVSHESDGRTLQQEPDAIIVSPLHPLRLAWHALAQRSLHTASRNAPCPAATILDPDCVPDVLCLPLRAADGGIRYQPFFSVECSSDYWSILWNAARLDRLPSRVEQGPFDQEFGINVGGVSSGFSLSQVRRALDDVSTILIAKPILNVLVASAAGHNEACNEGLIAWCRERFCGLDGSGNGSGHMGRRFVQIFDDRRSLARPDDAEISNVAEDSSNSVRWYGTVHEGLRPDLGIVAQLETSSPSATRVDLGSPVGSGALIRHRVRRQLAGGSGAFLTETRSGAPSSGSGDVLADKVMRGVVRLEGLGDANYGYTFAPSVLSIQKVLTTQQAAFVAVSSTAVDPACFLGGWLDDAYLWDYDLPSYSQRAGDTNGYYLLSKIKEIDRDTLGSVLMRLPGCGELPPGIVDEIVFEVARRGIPTVRGLSAGDSGASGDLGLFLASRLIQDEFRKAPSGYKSLLPVVHRNEDCYSIALVVPVDPFAGYLDDLRAATRGMPALRPDLLVASMVIDGSGVTCRLTPVEVKFRSGAVMPFKQCQEALGQAKALSLLLEKIQEQASQPDLVIWKLALQHALISMLGYAFRVYSQQRSVADQPGEWAALHQQVASAVLSGEISLQVDRRGRLVVFDASQSSAVRDHDGDGFSETIVVGVTDAALLVSGDPSALYEEIRSRVQHWDLIVSPAGIGSAGTTAIYDDARRRVAPVQEGQAGADSGVSSSVAGKVETEQEVQAAHESSGPPAPDQGDGTVPEPSGGTVTEIPPCGVELLVGSLVDDFRGTECRINLSDTNLNQLNIGVVGDLGTGKTQLLKSLIYQIGRAAEENGGIRPRFLIFDYKNDYSSPDFVRATGARVVQPQHLPLNLFDISGAAESVAPWLGRFKFFTDVLDKIYSGIGPVQRQQLKNAVRQAYDDCEISGRQPTIYDVHEKYRLLLGTKTDAPLSIIDDLVDMEMFSPDPGTVGSVDEFLDGVVVISLAALGQDDRTKNMLVAIMLNIFYEHMLRIPKRPYTGSTPQLRTIDSFLLVDEADNIMRYEFDVLRKILLQGREFGVGVILASQYLRHFKAGASDYREPLLTWFVHKVPNVTPQELGALGITADLAQLAERIKGLPVHHCMLKTLGVAGEIICGVPFYKLYSGEH